jgi:hypothetical protein
MTARLVECPNGHRVKPIPVIYGMPNPELLAESDRRRVRLGGCDPTDQDDRAGDCPTCGAPTRAHSPFCLWVGRPPIYTCLPR